MSIIVRVKKGNVSTIVRTDATVKNYNTLISIEIHKKNYFLTSMENEFRRKCIVVKPLP
jgi:hypothetical protein